MISIVVSMLLSSQAIENLPADCSKAESTPEINACGVLDVQSESRRMDQYLAAARDRAAKGDDDSKAYGDPTRQVDFLDRSQAAWVAYSTLVCDGVYDQWNGGTIRTVMALGCKSAMIRERTQVVWRDYLTYGDSTPPALPEPVGPAPEL